MAFLFEVLIGMAMVDGFVMLGWSERARELIEAAMKKIMRQKKNDALGFSYLCKFVRKDDVWLDLVGCAPQQPLPLY